MTTATANPPANHTMSALEWAMVVALSILWGGSFFFNGIAVREVPTLTVVACRIGLGAIVLDLVARAISPAEATRRWPWREYLVTGMLNCIIPFCLFVWAQSHIPSGLAAILNATTPLFGVLVAHFATADEPLTPARATGVALGFLGVVVMVGGDVLRFATTNIAAQAACIGAAMSYACAGVYGRRFRAMGLAPLRVAAGQVGIAAVGMVPIAIIIDRPWELAMPSGAAIAALIGSAVLSTALAYVLYFRILATAGATNSLLVTFLIPISALLLGVGFLGETLQLKQIAGMALIGGGLAAIDGRPLRLLRRWRARR